MNMLKQLSIKFLKEDGNMNNSGQYSSHQVTKQLRRLNDCPSCIVFCSTPLVVKTKTQQLLLSEMTQSKTTRRQQEV